MPCRKNVDFEFNFPNREIRHGFRSAPEISNLLIKAGLLKKA